MSRSLIALQNVYVRFGDHVALMDLSLKISEGSFVAIVGPNGAGKSTLLKVLLGLVKPTEGQVLVGGNDSDDFSSKRIGYVPQVKTLDRTFVALAIELVVTGIRGKWPARMKRTEIEDATKALEQVGAAHLAYRPISHLSGGELQRVYLARGFVRKPLLILLDEPATGMDVTGAADMYHILEDYQRQTGATVLMITHDWGAALHHASDVLLINQRLISFGPPNEALREENLRQAFGHLGHAHRMNLEVNHNA